QAIRALERARERAVGAGAAEEGPAVSRLVLASAAVDRALVEAQEAEAAIDAAADAFDFDPGRLDKTEERLFEPRGVARKLNVSVEELPLLRQRFAERLRAVEGSEEDLKAAEAAAAAARAAYLADAGALSAARRGAGERLAKAVEGELAPLKLEK